MAGNFATSSSSRRRLGAYSVGLLVLAVATQVAFSFESPSLADVESFQTRWTGKTPERTLRTLSEDTYEMTKFLEEDPNVNVGDCNRDRLNVYSTSFAALKADDNTEYLAHMFSSADLPCMGTPVMGYVDTNLKECLELADTYIDWDNTTATAFAHDNNNGDCYLFAGWRRHKYRMCKRDFTTDKIVYLRINEPTGFTGCDGVSISTSTDYTSDGLVGVQISLANDYCCCEVTRYEYEYLGNVYQVVDPFLYVYPLEDEGYKNLTNIRAYIDNNIEVAQLFDIIPEDDL